jgi:hypothetical protein
MRTITVIVAVTAILAGQGRASADVGSAWGINTHVPDTSTLDLVKQAGIGWIRVDFNWFTLEPGRDKYNWGYMDGVVSAAKARGLEIFATLAYSPSWASGTSNVADPPADPADWYDFVYDTVHRYSGSIHYWGMWNEPNLDGFFTGEDWQYREWILKPGSQAAKAADPGCFVLGPELAHLSGWDTALRNILDAGGKDVIDIITHHCYKGDTGWDIFDYLDPGAFHAIWDPAPLMDILDEEGVDKPVWLTEVGWNTDDVSESDQALYYHQLLWGVHERAWLEKVFPYEMKDDPSPGVPPWGIIRADYSPKPAYDKYRDFIVNPTNPGCAVATGGSRPGPAPLGLLLLAASAMAWTRRGSRAVASRSGALPAEGRE